jgi:hypothetical protein
MRRSGPLHWLVEQGPAVHPALNVIALQGRMLARWVAGSHATYARQERLVMLPHGGAGSITVKDEELGDTSAKVNEDDSRRCG